jgi:uncharacterized protein (DUF58 family)
VTGNPLHIDAELLASSRDLLLLAQSIVEGFAQGLHRSPYAGTSQEFASYRAFLPGDPPQKIDWKVYARSDDLFIREFEQETNFRGYLFLDASKSMDFGEGAGNKFHYGRLLCAVLAVLMHRQQDAPGMALFGKQASILMEDWWPPSTRRDHLENLVHHLENRYADGNHDNLRDLGDLVGECHRRSMAVLITDALVEPDELKEVLGNLQMRDTRVILFHLLARNEIEPDISLDKLLVDQETGEEKMVDGATYAQLHKDHLQKLLDRIQQVCHDTETEYCFLPTDQPLDEALHRFLMLRAG